MRMVGESMIIRILKYQSSSEHTHYSSKWHPKHRIEYPSLCHCRRCALRERVTGLQAATFSSFFSVISNNRSNGAEGEI
jgi:hypothetical protein